MTVNYVHTCLQYIIPSLCIDSTKRDMGSISYDLKYSVPTSVGMLSTITFDKCHICVSVCVCLFVFVRVCVSEFLIAAVHRESCSTWPRFLGFLAQREFSRYINSSSAMLVICVAVRFHGNETQLLAPNEILWQTTLPN